jgi:hypothetical protein
MTTFLVVNVVVLWVFVIFQGLVLLESVRQTSQLRRQADLDDKPIPFSLGRLAGRPLPEPAHALWSSNGGPKDGVLVLLSSDCLTCRSVAAGLPNLVNRFEDRRIVTVMQARSPDELNEALAETNLAPEEVVVDLENDYGAALGVQLRPAAVVVRDGIATEGAVVRSPRQLLEVLEGIETPVEAALDTSEARHLHSHEAEV